MKSFISVNFLIILIKNKLKYSAVAKNSLLCLWITRVYLQSHAKERLILIE